MSSSSSEPVSPTTTTATSVSPSQIPVQDSASSNTTDSNAKKPRLRERISTYLKGYAEDLKYNWYTGVEYRQGLRNSLVRVRRFLPITLSGAAVLGISAALYPDTKPYVKAYSWDTFLGYFYWRHRDQLKAVFSSLTGTVLEPEIKTGRNFTVFPDARINYSGAEENDVALAIARKKATENGFPVAVLELQQKNVDEFLSTRLNESVDAVVAAFTLSTVPDRTKTLAEFKRVLKPGGRLFFVEPVKPPSMIFAGLQTLLRPFTSLFLEGLQASNDDFKQSLADGTFESVVMLYAGTPMPSTLEGLEKTENPDGSVIWTGGNGNYKLYPCVVGVGRKTSFICS